MKFYVGNTDNEWFRYLKGINPEDVNFWQPGGKTSFKSLSQGEPFLFKLKSPYNYIGGIGFFSSHTFLPLNIAWDCFSVRNGCKSYVDFERMILKYRNDRILNPTIGCIVLTNPIFFNQEDWIPVPEDWSKNIVQGKFYDTLSETGMDLWNRVETVTKTYMSSQTAEGKPNEVSKHQEDRKYGREILTKVRLGQGAFRILVTDSYQRRCAITGERTLPVLEAAHIKAYSNSGPHLISNGLLLRSDLHKLFDAGYITIDTEYKVVISRKIAEEFQNGKEYYQHHGKELQFLPQLTESRPAREYILWHNENFKD